MTSIFVLSLLLGFLFGGLMLALAMGYVSTEQDRAREEEARSAAIAAAKVTSLPQFFADPHAKRAAAEDNPLDDEFVDQFQDYLREEQAVVARFINEPSIDNLYRQVPAFALIH